MVWFVTQLYVDYVPIPHDLVGKLFTVVSYTGSLEVISEIYVDGLPTVLDVNLNGTITSLVIKVK